MVINLPKRIKKVNCTYVEKLIYIINLCNFQRTCDCGKAVVDNRCDCEDEKANPDIKSNISYPYVIEPVYDSSERIGTEKREIEQNELPISNKTGSNTK